MFVCQLNWLLDFIEQSVRYSISGTRGKRGGNIWHKDIFHSIYYRWTVNNGRIVVDHGRNRSIAVPKTRILWTDQLKHFHLFSQCLTFVFTINFDFKVSSEKVRRKKLVMRPWSFFNLEGSHLYLMLVNRNGTSQRIKTFFTSSNKITGIFARKNLASEWFSKTLWILKSLTTDVSTKLTIFWSCHRNFFLEVYTTFLC